MKDGATLDLRVAVAARVIEMNGTMRAAVHRPPSRSGSTHSST